MMGFVECRGLNGIDHGRSNTWYVIIISFLGLIETRVSQANVQRVRRNLLMNWSWFDDYSGPEGRIWLVWNPVEVDVEILRVESQFISLSCFNKRLHKRCLISSFTLTVTLSARSLWGALCNLSAGISDDPWLVLGDFNAVMDDSEVFGRAADTSVSMTFAHAFGIRVWCSYLSLVVRLRGTIAVKGQEACGSGWTECSLIRIEEHVAFRFDNYLTLPGFLNSVEEIWKHRIHGTAMYETVCKLKLLKAEFRRQKKLKGNLMENVKKAKTFLDKAQAFFTTYKEDIFLELVKNCRRVYSMAVKLEISMLKQRQSYGG
ncbi:UNVERIFIED_CONTAM: hypothetical protein Scaly_3152300 [Sesamum calycinum]|uniref:Uncharacterized protein n=1 Tax=Sesamum calycinum TaxID=2727403 RepID=A0AAW2JG43_9LAMI